MTLAEQVADDYRHLDFPVLVTLTKGQTGEATANITAEQPKKNLLDSAFGGSLGVVAADLKWVLWAATMGGATVVTGDKITDPDGTEYIVTSVELISAGSVPVKWTCIARQAIP